MRKFICLLIITAFYLSFSNKTFAAHYKASFSILDSTTLPTATGTVNNDTVCVGETVLITVTLTGTGPWLVTGSETVNGGTPNIFTQTVPDSIFTFPALPDPGDNMYNIIDIIDLGAGDTNPGNIGGGAPINVYVHSLPVATGSISPDPVCFGNTVDIQVNLTGIGPWVVNGTDSLGGGVPHTYCDTVPGSVFNFQAIPDVGTTYYNINYVKDLTTGCINDGNHGGGTQLTAVAYPIPDVHVNGLVAADSVCEGAQLSLGVHFLYGSGPYMLKIKELTNDTNSVLISGDSTIYLNFPVAGQYSYSFLYITDNHGCSKELDYGTDISVFTIPQASLATFTSVCDTIEKVLLTQGTPAGGVYSGRGVYDGYFYPAIAGGPGTYAITYTLQNGPCSDSKTKNITVSLCSDLSISENNGPAFSIYPNPSDGNTNIHFSNINGVSSLQVISTSGQIVYSDMVNSSVTDKEINLNNLNAGIYFIKLMNDKNIRTEKLIIK